MLSRTDQARIVVWDLPTRVFHWLLVAFVSTNLIVADDRGIAFRVHVYCGYAIVALLVFRVLWGMIGGEHARFNDFVRPWSDVRDYLKSLLTLSPPRHVGHNPAGGWMIVLMLVTLTAIAATGMLGAVSAGASLPLLEGLPRSVSRAFREIHEGLGNFMIALVVLHLAGVVAEWILTRDNLVRAMIDGTKTAEAGNEDARAARWWLAVAVAAVALSLFGYLAVATGFR